MPYEHRQIVFTGEELSEAVEAHNRMVDPPAILGEYHSSWVEDDEVKAKSLIPDAEATQDLVVTLPKKFVLGSLIRFCVESNIKLPRAGRKTFMFVGGKACLEIVLDPDDHR